MNSVSPDSLFNDVLQAQHAGDFDKAILLLQHLIALGDHPLELDAQLELGRLLIRRGKMEEAIELLDAAHQLADKQGLMRKAIHATLLRALLERKRGNLDEASRLLGDTLPLPLHGVSDAVAAEWLHYRGLIQGDRNELADAERLLFRALELYKQIRAASGQAEVYDSLANVLLKHGKVLPALKFVDLSLAIKEKLGDIYGRAISYGTRGRALVLQANFVEAVEAFEHDLELARQCNDQAGIGQVLNSLGDLELRRKNLEPAKARYQQSLSANSAPINAYFANLGMVGVYLAASDMAKDPARLTLASEAADRSEKELEKLPLMPGLAATLRGWRGAIAWRQGDVESGERLLTEAIQQLGNQNNSMDTLPFLYELCDLHQSRGRTAVAVRWMSRALDLLHECGADESISNVENWLRKVDSPALTRLALERHFPKDVLEDIICGRLTHKNLTRRQSVAVLFSDIRGFTTLSEKLQPEELLDLLNEWFAEATQAIRKHHGFVDKFIGDAIMALFGLPEPDPNAAANAVRAALSMRDSLAALNFRHKALGLREIEIGVGIHTGDAVLGFLGSHLRWSFTALGDTVNTAQRLETATKKFGCDILISQAVQEVQRQNAVAETTPRGKAELTGRSPVIVYQVDGWRI